MTSQIYVQGAQGQNPWKMRVYFMDGTQFVSGRISVYIYIYIYIYIYKLSVNENLQVVTFQYFA